MTLLTAEGVTVRLHRRSVLDAVDLRVGAGEVLGLLGPNGAGKTTLVKALAGLLPCQGRVLLDGRPLAALPPAQRARQIAYLPQGATAHWPLPARDVVALGRLPHLAPNQRPSAADAAAVDAALAAVDVRHLADRPVTQLSGGERARVLLARALAVGARIVLADEPVAHLDPTHQWQVLHLLRRRAAAGDAVVVVLHDLGLAARHCDRVCILAEGRIAAQGAPAAVLDDALCQAVFGIRVLRGDHEGSPYILPWGAI